MALALLYGNLPPLAHQIAFFVQRRPQHTAIALVFFLALAFLRAEWAYFAPRIFLSTAALATPDDGSLHVRVMAAEERYQAVLRARQELIWRAGPQPGSIEAFPRDLQLQTLWDFFPPAFNCPHIVERVGSLGVGGKWVCGLDRIAAKRDCVVYSFGSSWESSFEATLLKRTKHCQIFGYHYDSKKFGPEVRSIDWFGWRTKFQRYGLSWRDAKPNWRTLSTLMFDNGHDFIDLIVIDIEGWEFPALTAILESYAGLTLPFGQLQLEVHVDDMNFEDFLKWWESLEVAGLRPFFTEPNLIYENINRGRPDIAEYSFLNIRRPNDFISNHVPESGAQLPTEPVA